MHFDIHRSAGVRQICHVCALSDLDPHSHLVPVSIHNPHLVPTCVHADHCEGKVPPMEL